MSSPLDFKGILPVIKPAGISSFSVVKKVRGLTNVKKVGHAGTLDPFAEGLLVIAIGREYTRSIDKYQLKTKHYQGQMVMGISTESADAMGGVKERRSVSLSIEILNKATGAFIGEIEQTPPLFSAKKVEGKRLYQYAREGKAVSIKPCLVHIYSFTIHGIDIGEFTTVKFSVSCSKGTYIRSLVEDFGQALGVPAYLKQLQRTGIGDICIENALDYTTMNEESIVSHLNKIRNGSKSNRTQKTIV